MLFTDRLYKTHTHVVFHVQEPNEILASLASHAISGVAAVWGGLLLATVAMLMSNTEKLYQKSFLLPWKKII